MPRRTVAAAVALTLLLVLSACGDADRQAADPDGSDAEILDPSPTDTDDDEPGDEPDNGSEDGSPDDEEPTMPADGDPEQAAIRDAAERAGVEVGEVAVVTNEQVTWPDGAHGCPQPGQFYTQALVEGYRIVVEAGGDTLHYHGQAGGPPAYCENPEEPAEGGQTGTVDR